MTYYSTHPRKNQRRKPQPNNDDRVLAIAQGLLRARRAGAFDQFWIDGGRSVVIRVRHGEMDRYLNYEQAERMCEGEMLESIMRMPR